jgi:DNA-directed RNA polymerase subunit RPC12/RpoP
MSEYKCDHCSQEVPDGDGLYLGDNRVCEPCYLTCNECGKVVSPDRSELWVSASGGTGALRVCHICEPPDNGDWGDE